MAEPIDASWMQSQQACFKSARIVLTTRRHGERRRRHQGAAGAIDDLDRARAAEPSTRTRGDDDIPTQGQRQNADDRGGNLHVSLPAQGFERHDRG